MIPRERYLVGKAFDYLRLLPALGRLPLPLAYRLARARGRWYARHRPAIRERIVRNAREGLGVTESAAQDLALRVFENHSLEELEAVLIPRLRVQDLPRLVAFEGLAHLDAALARGRGAIMLVCHFGSFPLGGALLGLRGYPIHGIAGPYGPPYTDPVDTRHIDRKVKGIERCTGFPFLYVGRSSGLDYHRALRAERVVSLAFDASLGNSERLPVTFLGRTAFLPYSFLRLAKLTGAPIVSYVTLRRADGIRNTIRVEPQETPPLKTREEFQQALQEAVDRLTGYIRQYPDHWFHIDTPVSWATLDALWASRPTP